MEILSKIAATWKGKLIVTKSVPESISTKPAANVDSKDATWERNKEDKNVPNETKEAQNNKYPNN